MDALDRIAQATLYEGYVLWPYRRSAVKNRQRWTFGGVYPAAYSAASGGTDIARMQTQCLIETEQDARIDIKVKFLHVVKRQVAQLQDGELEPVDQLAVAGRSYLSWDESVERQIEPRPITVKALIAGCSIPVNYPADEQVEWLFEPGEDNPSGALIRSWDSIEGRVDMSAEHLEGKVHRITVSISNTTRWPGLSRDEAVRRTMVSTHTILKAAQGAFVSLADPPEELRRAAEDSKNVGTWPVLVGDPPDRSAILSSPIIMSDYPDVAPESPGDMFDGGEIDELLILNTLSLTDEEKREMEATDPKTAEILERARSLSYSDLMKLHGVMRGA
ncbi:MAG: hypothetical protein KY393_02735 [Actinobacteria bacterium]|nr:hypothetical protein [Actinomycetota bacterium]